MATVSSWSPRVPCVRACSSFSSNTSVSSTAGVRHFSFTGATLKEKYPNKKSLFPTSIPPDVEKHFIDKLPEKCGKPPLILNLLKDYRKVQDPSAVFLVRAFEELAWGMDSSSSFFATADRQTLKTNIQFKSLMKDILDLKESIDPEWAPRILFSCAALEYRFWQLLPLILDHIEAQLPRWSLSALLSMIHSLGALNIGGPLGVSNQFGPDNELSRDYSHLARALLEETEKYFPLEVIVPEDIAAQCAAACFGLLQLGLEDHQLFVLLFRHAGRGFPTTQSLDKAGLTRFHLYQTLYCCDVLQPKQEEEIKRALPMKLQERLHEIWLPENVLLTAQPQGADSFQLNVEAALRRTKTQFLLNTSCGREEDEQHCFFASHLIAPNIAFEYDSFQPMGPDRPKVNGWIGLKQRVFPHFGLQTISFHSLFWNRLTEDEQDEQILRVRAQAGYQAEPNPRPPLRQRAFGYKGLEHRGRFRDKMKLVAKEREMKHKAEIESHAREKEWKAAKKAAEQ